MNRLAPMWLVWLGWVLGIGLGTFWGWALFGDFTNTPEPALSVPLLEVDTDAQYMALMEECDRCRAKEANNWQDAIEKRYAQLADCKDLIVIYERQNQMWCDAPCNLKGRKTCGPYNWTCDEALEAAAMSEHAYHQCLFSGYFPGYTRLESWLEDYQTPEVLCED